MHSGSDCPDGEVLQRFLLGQFPSAEVERLAAHVESCARCVDTLQSLHCQDELLQALATPRAAKPPGPEQWLASLWAMRPPAPFSDTNISGGLLAQAGAARPEDTEDDYEYLAPAAAPEELGRLGAYRVLRILGKGGMGVVFLAEDPHLQRLVALKVLRPGLLTNSSAQRRFFREAQAIAGLTHDHIVSILHVGDDRGVPFLAMPLLHGETLEARLQRDCRLPNAEVLRIGREIADGLAAAHLRGLIHRDIKPANVWLEADTCRVKILDFGLARSVADAVPTLSDPLPTLSDPLPTLSDAKAASVLTQSGALVGTPAYMAPEQARGAAVDHRCDLFSLGAVLYRMCTGQIPFPGANTPETLRALEQGLPDPPHVVHPAVPRALSDLIVRLLAKNPAERLPSARAVGEALQTLQREDVPPTNRTSRGRRLSLAALGGAVVLAGIWFAVLRGLPDNAAPHTAAPTKRTASARPCHFAPAVHYAVGARPYAVAVGDFNGDGKTDLAVSNIRDNTISVLLGNGDGIFRAVAPCPTGSEPHGLVVGDFNGDGHLDLAVANLKDNSVSVLLGNGDGTFRPAGRFATGAGPLGLALGDFNGDGKLDLVVTNSVGNSMTILLGQGDGTFRPGPRLQDYLLLGAPTAVAVADFNGDGKQDLVVANGGADTVCIFLGNGDGSFHIAERQAVGSGPGVVVVGDFNQDGRIDVAVENFGSNDVSVLLGHGDGTFAAAASYPAGWGPGGLAVGDFNGDGIADLVVANHDSQNLSFLVGKPDGTFRAADHYAAAWTPAGVAVADFNGDGRLDVVVVNHHSHTVSVLLNQLPCPHFRLATSYQATSDQPFTLTVTALDAWNRPDPKYTGTIRYSSTDPQAVLPNPTDFSPPYNNVRPARITFRTAGLQTLTVTDTADGSRMGNVAVLVLAGSATQFRLGVPERVGAGQAFAVTVSAIDAHGNSAANYTGTVRFTGGGANAVLPEDYPFVAADDGRHTFQGLILRTPGKHTLTITNLNNPKISASAHITVQQP